MNIPDRALVILDVGHGNCAVLKDETQIFVIDAGPKNCLLEFLTQEGISRVDAVLISHADQDHLAGLVGLLSSGIVQIERIRLNSDAQKGSEIWDDFLYELNLMSVSGKLDFQPALTPTNTGEFNTNSAQLEILAPSTYLAAKGPGATDRQGRKIYTNSISAVIRVLVNGNPVAILMGDIDDVGIDDLAKYVEDATAPVLVFPHHGGKARSKDLDKFVQTLVNISKASTIIFSIGRGKQYGTPRPEVVAALRKLSSNLRIACTQLSEHCAITLPTSEPKHLAGIYAKGWEKRICCAGSLVIDLDDPTNIVPDYSTHQDFISESAPTALCQGD